MKVIHLKLLSLITIDYQRPGYQTYLSYLKKYNNCLTTLVGRCSTIQYHYMVIRVGNASLVAKGALAHRLQRRTACKIHNGRQGAPKWPTGSGKVSTPRFLGILSNFRLISFLIQALLLFLWVTGDHPWWVTILGLVAKGVWKGVYS